MIHRKVKIPCGLFDTVSPSYGRQRIRTEGMVIGPSGRMDTTQRGIGQSVDLAALADRRQFTREVTRHGMLTRRVTSDSPRLVDNRPPRFVNRARLSRA